MESYKLEIERNQYDRIAKAFNEPNGLIVRGYDNDKDTVIFTISEQLKKRCEKFAKTKGHNRYWICQMFLPKNIQRYLVK